MARMTPSTLRPRHALAALALPLLLTACGDGADPAADASGAAGVVDATDEEIADALDSLDDMSADTALEAVGDAVVRVLDDATGYDVDGDVLYVDVDGDPQMAISNCQIVLGAASAFTDDPQIVLRYDGDEVDCSELS